ncbi:MAG TPA: ABC transporter permease subunit [Polyangia bacterium]|nr:ABC transporter permease subunit [Polyangia bacterium]
MPGAVADAAPSRDWRDRLAAIAWPAAVGGLSGALLLLVLLPIAGLLFTSSPRQLLRGLGDPMVAPAIRLTIATTLASIALIVLGGTPLAWLIARRRNRVWSVLETVVQLPVVLPPAVAGVALLLAFGRRGLLGPGLAVFGVGLPLSTAAVVLAQSFVVVSFYVQVAIAAFRRLDTDLVLVARTLGASSSRVFFMVAVPFSWPTLTGNTALN